MTPRWLAPLALLVLSPALAHADPTPAAASAASTAPAAAARATPATAAKAAPVATTAATAAKVAPAPAAVSAKAPAQAAKKSEPVVGKTATRPRPRRLIEQREAAAAKVGSEPRHDMTIAARPQQPLVTFVVEKTPVRFELPELHPGQYDVPGGLPR